MNRPFFTYSSLIKGSNTIIYFFFNLVGEVIVTSSGDVTITTPTK